MPATKPPRLEVADIVRLHGPDFERSHVVTPEQRRVLRAITACRTAALGGHVDVCDACGFERPNYNSCRDRHCPKCQSLAQAKWIAARKERLLPTSYFHVVFTLPAELRAVAAANREAVFDLLFDAASATLLTLGQHPKHLGALLGITAVLHTWTRTLAFHPHLHCIVTAGGLDADGTKWVASNEKYLFPVQALSSVFRGKFMDGLARASARGDLDIGGEDGVARLRELVYRTPWVVYAKAPFGGPEHLVEYLGRYTHRIGISNHRLIALTDDAVRFATKDGKTATLTPDEFLRRFVSHVLPAGFVKMRHYGLFASGNVPIKLAQARRLLELANPRKASPCAFLSGDARDILLALTGIDIALCPRCLVGPLRKVPLPSSRARDGPTPSRAEA